MEKNNNNNNINNNNNKPGGMDPGTVAKFDNRTMRVRFEQAHKKIIDLSERVQAKWAVVITDYREKSIALSKQVRNVSLVAQAEAIKEMQAGIPDTKQSAKNTGQNKIAFTWVTNQKIKRTKNRLKKSFANSDIAINDLDIDSALRDVASKGVDDLNKFEKFVKDYAVLAKKHKKIIKLVAEKNIPESKPEFWPKSISEPRPALAQQYTPTQQTIANIFGHQNHNDNIHLQNIVSLMGVGLCNMVYSLANDFVFHDPRTRHAPVFSAHTSVPASALRRNSLFSKANAQLRSYVVVTDLAANFVNDYRIPGATATIEQESRPRPSP